LELVARGKSYLIANAWSPAKTALLRRVATRPVTIDRGRSIVSFTFDDVPRDVMENAAPVLDEHGVKGTFYVALGMSRPNREFFAEEQVKALTERGHHIGCHTFTHYSLREGSAEGLYEDALAGKRALEPLVGGPSAEHVSCPYGAVSLRAKTLLRDVFATMRTSAPGINVGRVDLTYLRAENLYSRGLGLDLDKVRRRVQSIGRRGGWLIFYTHGVSNNPGRYDTSSEDFRRTVEIVMESGAPVLPVPDALRRLRTQAHHVGV
jgi:peptidoglycan/xylan/chitin deacetylase (PgdA/CDA1 family)